MDAHEIKARIGEVSRWSLWLFCERLGLHPNDKAARQQFEAFQELARLIGRLDRSALARVLAAESEIESARRIAAVLDKLNSRTDDSDKPIN